MKKCADLKTLVWVEERLVFETQELAFYGKFLVICLNDIFEI